MLDEATQLEKHAGQNAARNIGRSLRKTLKDHFSKDTGLLFKTSARAKMRYGSLDRIEVNSPHYSFMQHYGYTRKYSNGNTIEIPGTEHFSKALDKTSALDVLADKIAEIRIDKITSIIRF